MLIRPQPVIQLAVLPILHLDNHINGAVEFDGRHAEQTPHVYHPNAPQLNIIADQLRRGTDQAPAGITADLNGVVGNEAMASFYQLNGGLALADARFPRQHNPLAVHLHQNTVAGNGGRKGCAQVGNHGAHNAGCIFLGAEDGLVVLFCHFHALRIRFQSSGKDYRRSVVGKQGIEHRRPLFRGDALQVRDFHQAQQLHPLPVKVVKESAELKAGPVHVVNGNELIPIALRPV